jgi:uncharacterized membrane protein
MSRWFFDFKYLVYTLNIMANIYENRLLMAQAREALRGRWGVAVGGTFVYLVVGILVVLPKNMGNILALFTDGPLLLGFTMLSLSLARKQQADVSQVFLGFNDFLRALVTYLLMMLFILLWGLLLIVPGVIAAFEYSQVFYILAEDKNIKPMDALRKSKAMMEGHKGELFRLGLKFLGWFLLSILTLGIGLLWAMPYFQTTMALFYDKISKKEVAV